MFGLGIRYLFGWAMAAIDGAAKQLQEWPPHPDRVFMALAAAWFETGKDQAEGEALSWLEDCGAPRLSVSLRFVSRDLVTHYVPVNDDVAPYKWDSQKKMHIIWPTMGSHPLGRNHQARSFPVAIPDNPVVHLMWEQGIPEDYRVALGTLCAKVGSIGHSASLVQMWLTDDPPQPTLVPVAGVAQHRLRMFGPGSLSYLERRYNRDEVLAYVDLDQVIGGAKGKEKKRLQSVRDTRFPNGKPVSLRPEAGLWQGYSAPAPASAPVCPGGVFDPRMVVLAFSSGKRLPLNATLKVTQALRGALLSACPEPIPEWLSGHDARGRASREPHVAFLTLPFVGHEHADGRLLGVALALPRALKPDAAAQVFEPWVRDANGLPRSLKLFDGEWLQCSMELETRETPPHNLRMETWTGPSRNWGTVTPVVLDRHFDGPTKWELAAEGVKDSCERAGLPRPAEVLLHPVSMFEGVPRSSEFPWMTRKHDGGRLHHAHATILFDCEVQGPVLVGAGRFRGYGLCRPLPRGGVCHD